MKLIHESWRYVQYFIYVLAVILPPFHGGFRALTTVSSRENQSIISVGRVSIECIVTFFPIALERPCPLPQYAESTSTLALDLC